MSPWSVLVRFGFRMKIPVALLMDYARRNGVKLTFEVVSKTDERVVMKFVIDGKEYPAGVGRNENEAMQNAAKRALRRLNDKENPRPVDSPEETNPGNGPSETTSTHSEKLSTKSNFICKKFLGKGGFGRVYQVQHELLDQLFAVKIVPYNEKALREAKAISDLKHPHIVRCFFFWVEDSGYLWDSTDDSSSSSSQSTIDLSGEFLYIQMELCDTKTLRERIDDMNERRSERDSERREKSLTIVQQIFSAVEYIHSKNLIHRDLKPSNIMFGEDGKVKIGDFGLVTDETDDSGELMKRTRSKGTKNYMAPEQEDNKPYDRKVDIFPLGLIYFELLWKISTCHERNEIWKHVRERKLPKEFAYRFTKEHLIIMSLLSMKPQDRPEASKVKTDLEQFSRKLTHQKTERRNNRTV